VITEHDPLYSNLFRRYAEGIIYKPAQMRIDEVEPTRSSRTLHVYVHPDDIGLLCGKAGRTIKELQLIFRAIGARNRHNVRISVAPTDDTAKAQRQPSHRFQEIGTWSRSQEAVTLIEDTIREMGYDVPVIEPRDHHDTTNLIATSNCEVPDELFTAMNSAIHAWGKSLGRHIFLLRTDQIRTTSVSK
jgi:predicted RNA-binding protein YlqC (UPF0109 family)